MSDRMGWRYGDTNPVVAAVDSSTVIEIGDLVWQDVDDAKPASDVVPQGTGPYGPLGKTSRESFVDNFLGVAIHRSRSGDTWPIRVATTGVFEFDCFSGTFELGDLVGGHAYGDGGIILNQTVAPVSGRPGAIGRVARREAVAVGSVLVDIRSTVMTGGV